MTEVTFTELNRVDQQDNFDCGIACVLAIIESLQESADRKTRDQLLEAVGTTSVWTVDLALLLVTECGFSDVEFFTILDQANPMHGELAYYSKNNNWTDESKRVEAAFERARSTPGLQMTVASQPLSTVLGWLEDSVVIMLVDSLLLDCVSCDECRGDLNELLPSEIAWRLAPPSSVEAWLAPLRHESSEDDSDSAGQYQGHFITLCGFSMQAQLVFYVDPSPPRPQVCAATFAVLDRARRQRGTDEDLVRVRVSRDKTKKVSKD